MKYLKKVHNKAMELLDEAKIAKMGKDMASSDAFLRTAFVLEKYVALNFNQEAKEEWFRYVLLRSAAALAIDCKEWDEAEKLIKIAREGTLPVFLEEQLKDLEQKMQNSGIINSTNSTMLYLTGILTHADSKINEIIVEDIEKIQSYNIMVPAQELSAIVKSYWQDKVIVKAKSSANGLIILETIKKAA